MKISQGHECLQETAIALLKAEADSIGKFNVRIEDKLDGIYKLLQGDDGAGLTTKSELHEQSIARLWITMWALWLAIGGIVGIIIGCLKSIKC